MRCFKEERAKASLLRNFLMGKEIKRSRFHAKYVAFSKFAEKRLTFGKRGNNFRAANLKPKSGQASVEFVIVAAILMIIFSVLFLLACMAANGQLAKVIDSHASHDISNLEGVFDVALY